MSIREFLKECNDRDVFKRVSIYIVSSWVVLQVLVAIWSPLGIPEISVTYLILILLIGFPFYLYFFWKAKSHLILTDPDDMEEEEEVLKVKRKQFKTMYFRSLGFISVLSIAAVGWIINNNFIGSNFIPQISTDKIAVLNFDNDTGDKDLDIVGKMAADWLIHGITENHAGEVISSQVIDNYSNLLTAQIGPTAENAFTSFFKTDKVVRGAYFLREDKLVFQCIIQDGQTAQNVMAFEQLECSKDNALDCIEELKQKVITYFGMKEEGSLGIEEYPPKYEAYQKRLLARDVYEQKDLYIKLLNEAISIDSTYFEPQILRVQHYFNIREYAKADSLFKMLNFENRLAKRQTALLNFTEAILEGKNDKAWRNFKYEYDIVPKDPETNSTYMTLSLQFVNKPDLLEASFQEIPMDDFNLEDCIQCAFRYYTMGLAHIELGEYEKAVELLEPVIDILEQTYIKRTLAAAYAALNQDEKINALLNDLELKDRVQDKHQIGLHVGTRYLLNGQQDKAKSYFESLIGHNEAKKGHRAEAYYFLGDYENAEKLYRELYNQDNNSINARTMLAISLFKMGKADEADSILSRLEDEYSDFDFGEIDYNLAKYYAAKGEKDEALRELQKSVLKGKRYFPTTYQNDPHFLKYLDSPIFNTILTSWH
ncbi:MAG: tetratricopeptide repeat protein [Bacteroidia bacterium]|nr:tetratricopeptide repeat protein [Bacteroidia bacterium]